jgi:hypothetical protein
LEMDVIPTGIPIKDKYLPRLFYVCNHNTFQPNFQSTHSDLN